MRLFRERVGVSTSYIHAIEKNGVLPGLERSKELAEVFRQVAAEQGATEPDDDARDLLRARERTLLTDRLDVPPMFAELLIALRDPVSDADVGREVLVVAADFASMDKAQRKALAKPLQHAFGLFKALHPDEWSGLERTIERTARVVEAVEDAETRRLVISRLVENLDDILDQVETGKIGENLSAGLAELAVPGRP
jgi:DNA-binding XRE family transcriptional regulator